MKLNKINTIFITTLFTIQSYGSDYDNASFENYVTGQGVNEVILEAQEIICSLAKLRTEDLAGDGSYIATIFSDECVQTSLSNSTDSVPGEEAGGGREQRDLPRRTRRRRQRHRRRERR